MEALCNKFKGFFLKVEISSSDCFKTEVCCLYFPAGMKGKANKPLQDENEGIKGFMLYTAFQLPLI